MSDIGDVDLVTCGELFPCEETALFGYTVCGFM